MRYSASFWDYLKNGEYLPVRIDHPKGTCHPRNLKRWKNMDNI